MVAIFINIDYGNRLANISVLFASSNLLEMPTNWYKMAAIMNRYYGNDGIEEMWEAVCASLVPERSKLR